ncbi:MAG: GDP-L-fucose synthase [Pseudomonadota bacterium]
MELSSRIFVAGHQGMIGSAVVRQLRHKKYKNLLMRNKTQLDLTNLYAVNQFFQIEKPEYVVLAAGLTGGIMENQRIPADFLHINLSISLNVLNAAYHHGIKKLIFLGSSCMYPRYCDQPMTEEMLFSGKPEETSLGTSVSKLAGMQLCIAYNQQCGKTRFLPLIPNSTYGPYDNFNPATGHVLSVLIHRFHEAKCLNMPAVELWGSGKPRREFIYVDDVASACIAVLKHEIKAGDIPINIGVGHDISIFELAELIALIVGFTGKITWNTEKPDGALYKRLESSRIRYLGWAPLVALEEGIRRTYQWYLNNIKEA